MPPRPLPIQPIDPNPKFRIKRLGQGWSEWYAADMALDVLAGLNDIKAVEIRETMTQTEYFAYLRKFAI